MGVLSSFSSDSGDLAEVQQAQPNCADVPCVYCRGEIAAGDFEYWSAARRLVSATCPHCERRVTLAAKTWRRWIRQAQTGGTR